MRPTLFSLRFSGHEAGLHTYGILVALGFAIGIVLFWREGRRSGLDGGRLLDLSFWSIVAGLAGSRLAFVILNAHDFADACFDRAVAAGARIWGCVAVLRFWEGGFVFYGGVIASSLVILMFCRREGWSFWRLGDLAAPTLAVGHALGRLGCFFAGCCFGKACGAPWAVTFPPDSVAYQELEAVGTIARSASRTPPLHPTQLYEAVGELAIFALLLVLRHRWRPSDFDVRRRARRPGGLILTYAASYATLRFVVEIFRGDSSRRYLARWASAPLAAALGLPPDQPQLLSISQLVSLLILGGVVGVAVWRVARTRAATRGAMSAPKIDS
jgi:phosphatidylglycerol:prolipoprotein diacylglycerol transferase